MCPDGRPATAVDPSVISRRSYPGRAPPPARGPRSGRGPTRSPPHGKGGSGQRAQRGRPPGRGLPPRPFAAVPGRCRARSPPHLAHRLAGLTEGKGRGEGEEEWKVWRS
ncbi:hypothetical protein DAI22_03g270700 [Oryza sativa Japonica Group]|nr:hypothetical protein DAI22_03g270700 [Oryza sativa Japonica Group]